MAITSGSQVSYAGDSKQNRESLSDVIYRTTPTDTPFLSMLERVPGKARLEEWLAEDLAAAANNAALEGDTGTSGLLAADAQTTRIRWDNTHQISRKIAEVSGTAEKIQKAGMKSQLQKEIVNKSLEMKRDMEYAITRNKTYVLGNSTTARQTRDIDGWIYTNWLGGTGAAAVGDPTTNTGPTDGTTVAYSETILKSMLQKVYNSGGDPTVIMLSAANKQVQSGFSGNATRQQDVAANKLVAGYDVYVSDFGRLKLVPNRHQNPDSVHVLDMNYWKLAELRSMETTDLAKIGDSTRKMIISEYALICGNEKASGNIRDTA